MVIEMRLIGRSVHSFISRLRGDQSGASLVEFALIAPMLILLTVGLLDVARLLWYQNTLAHAVREGTRFASVHGPGSDIPVDTNGVATYIANRTVGISQSNLNLDIAWADGQVTIGATYDFNFLVAGFVPGLGHIDLASQSSMYSAQ